MPRPDFLETGLSPQMPAPQLCFSSRSRHTFPTEKNQQQKSSNVYCTPNVTENCRWCRQTPRVPASLLVVEAKKEKTGPLPSASCSNGDVPSGFLRQSLSPCSHVPSNVAGPRMPLQAGTLVTIHLMNSKSVRSVPREATNPK